MSEPLYNVVFYGNIQPDKDKKSVIMAMAAMFKTEPTKVLPYFSGDRKVIKTNLNKATVIKYKAALEKIGLVIKIENAGSNAGQAAAPVKKAPQKSPASSGNAKPLTQAQEKARAEAEAIGAQIDTNGISMAEVGADVIENPVEVTPQPIGDISDLSMAEVGADVIENPVEKEAAPIPDISDISMAEVGADVIENPKEKEAAPLPDISELTLE